jgi:hypothetical protein
MSSIKNSVIRSVYANIDFTQEPVGLRDCVNALTKIRFPRNKILSTLEGLLYIQVTTELFKKIL